jgi:hypothetical protein
MCRGAPRARRVADMPSEFKRLLDAVQEITGIVDDSQQRNTMRVSQEEPISVLIHTTLDTAEYMILIVPTRLESTHIEG